MRDWNPGPAWLFCPANRTDRYGKALAAADVVILDLEDAVAPDQKDAAREAVRGLVRDELWAPERTVLRLNASSSEEHAADLALVREISMGVVMLSKTEDPAEVEATGTDVVALVETPHGIQHVDAIAASPHTIAIFWGADDLVAGLGGSSSRHPDGRFRDIARHARARSLIAAKANGRLALDAVHMEISDVDGLAAECEDAAAVGFDGTVAIHPSQVPTIRDSYAPDDATLRWARRLLEHVGPSAGVTTFEGRMVDGPIYAQAQRIIARAGIATDPR